jgi:hypothetical protein
MSSQYKKIKYETEGSYGSTEEKWLYVWSHDTVDIVNVFDDSGKMLFSYSETGFDMGQALAIIGTNWNDERLVKLTSEDFKKIGR